VEGTGVISSLLVSGRLVNVNRIKGECICLRFYALRERLNSRWTSQGRRSLAFCSHGPFPVDTLIVLKKPEETPVNRVIHNKKIVGNKKDLNFQMDTFEKPTQQGSHVKDALNVQQNLVKWCMTI